MRLLNIVKKLMWTFGVAVAVGISTNANAALLNISDNPLFLNTSVPPLNMLIMGRDHKLYYEAYNDASDLNGDGVLDLGYKGFILKTGPVPAGESLYVIDYFGYFDSMKCYSHVSNVWDPVGSVLAGKTCPGTQWSGDFLNYLTTARIDALRKVMYGGDRSTDDNTETILERTYVPQDAHSWGKEYTSGAALSAGGGYNIEDYTGLTNPAAGLKIFFANTTVRNAITVGPAVYAQPPVLRVMTAPPVGRRVWNWVSKERPVADSTGNCLDGAVGCAFSLTDYTMRIRVCKTGFLETNCKNYPNGNNKPTGIIQDYGEGTSPRMYFGLITGSYAKNTNGGVLRRKMGSPTNPLSNEIDANSGVFSTSFSGIIATFNRLHPTGFRGANSWEYSGAYAGQSCGWIVDRAINQGECQMWGNPLAEMMFESLRYFAGRSAALTDFATTQGQGEESELPVSTSGVSLPIDTWDNPYSGQPTCAKPFQTIISDINPTYDSDKVPGTAFPGGFTNSELSGLNAATLGQTIWTNEFGGPRNIFIGETDTEVNSAPTVKSATSFGNIRGLAPEDPTKQGSYYSGSVAYYGNITDINPVAGNQKVNTFAVALASPLPKIEIPVGTGRITLVPFAKSVAGGTPNIAWPAATTPGPLASRFQPTNQIVDFYVDTLTPTYGKFRVNFEDVEQGADHDMDAITVYEYTVTGSTVSVTLTSEYAAGGITQHMGYIISGTTRDGIYLEVLDQRTGDGNPDPDYFLDTPPTYSTAGSPPPAPNSVTGWADGVALPFIHTRSFTAGSTPGAILLNNPLWYAAKWGGFEDSDNSNTPNVSTEWDENGDGTPDNYFLVTNALHLGQQLANAFDEINERVGSASSASVNAGSISSDTRVYQAKFNSGNWTGQLLSFPVQTVDNAATPQNEIGTLLPSEWDASQVLPAHGSRKIFTINQNTGGAVPFRWGNTATTIGAINQGLLTVATDGFAERRLDYIRGDATWERLNVGGVFRNRSNKLGDIVSSSPVFIGRPNFFYPDASYTTFANNNATRTPMVYVGANDGMLHGFRASDGVEQFAFIPRAVWGNLVELPKPGYSHRFFVDGTPTVGDVFYSGAWHTILVGSLNKGGKSVFALDITDPGAFSSETSAANTFRWEFMDDDLGFTYSRPAIVKMQNGVWAAVFGNGYNAINNASSTGRAYLYVVNIETGALIRKIDTGVGSVGTPNGLATPALVDLNGDDLVDYAYAGDLRGNLWKFNLTDTSITTNWDIPYTTTGLKAPLYIAQDTQSTPVRQPITSKPEVTRGPKGQGMLVLFGTGRFLEIGDKLPSQKQTFYGIIDQNTNTNTDKVPAGRGSITQQSIITEQVYTFGSVSIPLRTTTANAVTNRGWYLDLVSPSAPSTYREMQVSDSVLRNGRIIFTTLIPDSDPCSAGGTSWLMEMNALTGGRLTESPFDNNRDGQFTDSDFVTLPDGTRVPVSGMQSEVGIAQRPGILAGETQEYKYLSGTTQDASGSNIQRAVENPGPGARGRQSWRQVK